MGGRDVSAYGVVGFLPYYVDPHTFTGADVLPPYPYETRMCVSPDGTELVWLTYLVYPSPLLDFGPGDGVRLRLRHYSLPDLTLLHEVLIDWRTLVSGDSLNQYGWWFNNVFTIVNGRVLMKVIVDNTTDIATFAGRRRSRLGWYDIEAGTWDEIDSVLTYAQTLSPLAQGDMGHAKVYYFPDRDEIVALTTRYDFTANRWLLEFVRMDGDGSNRAYLLNQTRFNQFTIGQPTMNFWSPNTCGENVAQAVWIQHFDPTEPNVVMPGYTGATKVRTRYYHDGELVTVSGYLPGLILSSPANSTFPAYDGGGISANSQYRFRYRDGHLQRILPPDRNNNALFRGPHAVGFHDYPESSGANNMPFSTPNRRSMWSPDCDEVWSMSDYYEATPLSFGPSGYSPYGPFDIAVFRSIQTDAVDFTLDEVPRGAALPSGMKVAVHRRGRRPR